MNNILPIIVGAIIGAVLTLVTSRLNQHWQRVNEKAKISNFISGCIQNDIVRIEAEAKNFRSNLNNPDKEKLHASTFSWQHESVLIQTISDQIGALDISIVKEFNNYVNMINQSKAFRESLRQALIKNDNDVNKVKLELKVYISVLEAHIEVGKKIVGLINEKQGHLAT